jgi:hypothetical protein
MYKSIENRDGNEHDRMRNEYKEAEGGRAKRDARQNTLYA